MEKIFELYKPEMKNGKLVAIGTDGKVANGIIRDHMLELALEENQCIQRNIETGKCYRRPIEDFESQLNERGIKYEKTNTPAIIKKQFKIRVSFLCFY